MPIDEKSKEDELLIRGSSEYLFRCSRSISNRCRFFGATVFHLIVPLQGGMYLYRADITVMSNGEVEISSEHRRIVVDKYFLELLEWRERQKQQTTEIEPEGLGALFG